MFDKKEEKKKKSQSAPEKKRTQKKSFGKQRITTGKRTSLGPNYYINF